MKHLAAFATRPIAATGLVLCTALAAPAAHAVNYTLVAAPTTATMPDGTANVPMWGYRVCPGTVAAAACTAPITSPGAAMVVPAGDTQLMVTLHNQLGTGRPTSFVVHGLNTAMAPVFTNASGATCTPGAGADAVRRACRLRSFTTEAAPGGSATYTYNNVRPGTYLYQSGTLPQVQVQMGLYGMVSKDAAVGTAYPGVTYGAQTRIVFSEVDAAMHASVNAGTLAGSTLDYDPRHLRTHVYDETTQLPVQVNSASTPQAMGTPHLIRMVNAGLQSRVPTLSDGTWALLAEDAQPYPFAREQYSALMPAAKAMDAFLGTPRPLVLFDRRMGFADAGAAVAGHFVRFDGVAAPPANLSHNCATTGTQGVAYTCTASSTTAGATLALVSGPAGMTMAAGVISWTPTNAQAQKPATPTLTNPVVISASAAGSATATASFSIAAANVNDAPTAAANTYAATPGSLALTVPVATGVLANDSDPDGDPLAASVQTPPADGTLALAADGSFTYTLPAGTVIPSTGLTRSFTYTATDTPSPGPALSASATVTMNFSASVGPVANPDVLTFNNTLLRPNASIAVLANDTSALPLVANAIEVAREADGVGGTNGTLNETATRGRIQTPNSGVLNYRAPISTLVTTGQSGTDYFYYRVRDNANNWSAWTRVDVTMN